MDDEFKKDRTIRVLQINDHINRLIIEHLNDINKAQKEQYEAIIEKMSRFFIKEINDVLDQKTT